MLLAFSIVALLISMVALCGVSMLIGMRKGERTGRHDALENQLALVFRDLGDMINKISGLGTMLSTLPSTAIPVGTTIRGPVRPSPKVCRKHNSPTCTTCDSEEDYKS